MNNKRLELLFLHAIKLFYNSTAICEWTGIHWKEISFQSLQQEAEKFADALREHHIRSGERIIIISHNRIQAIIALFGIWLTECTAVLIDPDLPEIALLNQCEIADARFIILEKEIISQYENTINTEYFIILEDEKLIWQAQKNNISKKVYQDCDKDIAAIMFTSGTTGDYKGVMLTHSNFIYLNQFYKDLSPQDGCSLTVLPLFHVAGLFCGFLQPLFLGVKIAMFRTFSAEALQNAFLQYQPTVIISVPRLLEVLDQKIFSAVNECGVIAKIIFNFLLTLSYIFHFFHINAGKLFFKSLHQKFGERLKKILCGSAPLSPQIQKHFLSFGFEVLLSYGLTETCGPITLTKVNHRWKLGNVGPCVEKNNLKINTAGEILYRGHALMAGYFRDKNATIEAFYDGFFQTRDLGRLDQFGNLFIDGRIKELIVFSDGKKAIPEQIEKQYAKIPDIKEYAIFAAQNNNTQIAVFAFVPADNTNENITTQKIFQCASQLKSPYQISDVMICESIPRSNTLKIKRHTLLEKYNLEKIDIKNLAIENSDISKNLKKMIDCFQSVMPNRKNNITADITFAELNIDSLLVTQLCEKINTTFNTELQPTEFWFSSTIRELHNTLFSNKQKISVAPSPDKLDVIAIVAVDCIFPDSCDYTSFWKNLISGKDVITDIPLSRWNNNDFYDPYPLAPGKTNANQGGFIELPNNFPCEQFNIKPRIAESMDPQQKILLMMTNRLIAHQKIKRTGLFIGAGFPDFMIQSIKNISLSKINPYSGINMSDFSLSSRVAYHFNFEGPAMVIKTACSSALVAVHQAMRALQAGDCDSAIAGGINLMLTPDINVCLTKGGFLSPDNRCKSFDANANGYVRSEGCGLVLLKRYEDAIKDNDKILNIILGSTINQDGASNGIAAPSGKAQIACYQMALENAGLSPDQIDFIESHGSGTQLGDAIEMQSIQAVYDHNRNKPLFVGAVKSSIGHCESAAGIAGLIKTMLVLQYQKIPPNLHYKTPNPHISFKHSKVILPHKKMVFEKQCHYAAISSFGVAGTNVHMIIK